MSRSRDGILEVMTKVNLFMEHNGIKINVSKSTYHWTKNETTPKSQMKALKKEGQTGMFTYLG